MTEKFETARLRDEWDASEQLRARIRAGNDLLEGSLSDFSINRCVANLEVLSPVLLRSVACGHKRPEVEGFREEIEAFLLMHQREATDSHVDDMAWEVRKLLTFLKRKTQRKEVSTVTCLDEEALKHALPFPCRLPPLSGDGVPGPLPDHQSGLAGHPCTYNIKLHVDICKPTGPGMYQVCMWPWHVAFRFI